MLDTLDKLFTFTKKQAKEVFDEHGNHNPLFLLQRDSGGPVMPVLAPWSSEEQMHQVHDQLRAYCRENNTKRAAIVMESTLSIFEAGDEIPSRLQRERSGKDVLFVAALTAVPGERSRCGYYEVVRSNTGKPKVGKFVSLDDGEATGMWDDLLPKRILH